MRPDIRFQPDEHPPRLLAAGLGCQYVLLRISAYVLIPAITFRSAGADEATVSWAVFGGLCASGASTILQSVHSGRIGAGYFLMMGTQVAFISASADALRLGGASLLATLVIASSLVQVGFSRNLSLFRRLITPQIAGTMMMLIAVTIMPILFDLFDDVPTGAGPLAAPASALTTLALIAGITLLGKDAWRPWSAVTGIAAGCLVAAWHGAYDTSGIAAAAWIGLPSTVWPGFDLQFDHDFWVLLPVFACVTVVNAATTIGNSIKIQQVSWRTPHAVDFRAVQRALLGDGASQFLAGLLGTMPTATDADGIPMTKLTGVASRGVGVWAGILLAAFAFLPKATAIILAVPNCVTAACLMLLLATLFVLGMQVALVDATDRRTSIVIGLAYWLGVGYQERAFFPDILSLELGTMLQNGMVAGSCAAIIMTAATMLPPLRRRKLRTTLETESLAGIDEFLRGFAKGKRWSPDATNRLCAAAEEAVLTLAPDVDKSKAATPQQLLLVVRGDRHNAEMDFVASIDGRNLEDQLALLGTWVEPSSDRDLSLRLLRHYAKSVDHRHYQGADILSVQVEVNSSREGI